MVGVGLSPEKEVRSVILGQTYFLYYSNCPSNKLTSI